MRRHLAVLTLAVMATACGNMSPEEQARTRQALSVACNVDGVIVPMAQPVVAELGPAGATAARVDLQVHPAVVAACEMLHGWRPTAGSGSIAELTGGAVRRWPAPLRPA